VHRLTTLLMVALVSFWATGVEAANIAILRPAGSSPTLAEALHRLKGELFALGLEVQLVERPKSQEPAAFDTIALSAGPTAKASRFTTMTTYIIQPAVVSP